MKKKKKKKKKKSCCLLSRDLSVYCMMLLCAIVRVIGKI